ncbi:hypothetical protein [Naasia aerilata]|uniref:HhH-GPD domain-containing protein n=1 Tax=Naasia aerilata TaxID=1162966 RepID=A0ABM8GGJ9_9MICO|nr:hypothetical protein [Naasia aerilata]BDZ47486.1 hypothetical protein GCM10025866_33950 [Naasia aerilata]
MTDLAPYDYLSTTDAVLARLLERQGPADPFSWPAADAAGSSNFAALALHITSQQISTSAALSIFSRIHGPAGGLLTAEDIVELGPERLRAAGLSHAKTVSLLDLAERQRTGTLDVDALDGLPDAEVLAALTAVKGLDRGRRRCSSSISCAGPTCFRLGTSASGMLCSSPGTSRRSPLRRASWSWDAPGRHTRPTPHRCSGTRCRERRRGPDQPFGRADERLQSRF